jgi:hypothetical protein
MLGREVVEGEQIGAILDQAFHRAVVLHARQAPTKKSKAALAAALVSAIQMSFRCALALGWTDLGMAFRTLACVSACDFDPYGGVIGVQF